MDRTQKVLLWVMGIGLLISFVINVHQAIEIKGWSKSYNSLVGEFNELVDSKGK